MELTEPARVQMARQLEVLGRADANDVCFRLTTNKGEAKITVSKPGPDDFVFKQGERIVLAVAPELAPRFADSKLDLRTDDGGTTKLVAIPTAPGRSDAG